MMTAIVVHFTDGNRYTSIDCCCRCSIDASKLRTQDYFILSSMDDNSCEILLTVTTRIIRTIIVYHKYYYFYIFLVSIINQGISMSSLLLLLFERCLMDLGGNSVFSNVK